MLALGELSGGDSRPVNHPGWHAAGPVPTRAAPQVTCPPTNSPGGAETGARSVVMAPASGELRSGCFERRLVSTPNQISKTELLSSLDFRPGSEVIHDSLDYNSDNKTMAMGERCGCIFPEIPKGRYVLICCYCVLIHTIYAFDMHALPHWILD